MRLSFHRFLLLLLLAALPACSREEGPDLSPEEESAEPVSGEQSETVRHERRSYDIISRELPCSRDGIDIYGVLTMPEGVEGPLPVVVFSHGLLGHFHNWTAYAEACARNGFAAYCFDFIGGSHANRSGGLFRDMSIFTEEEDLKAVLDMILHQDFTDGKRVFLAGASQGGLVSAMTAADRPEDIRGLFLLYPAFNIPELGSYYIDLYGGYDNLPDKVSILGFTLYRKYAENLSGYDPYAEISRYGGDVLVLHGTFDLLVPLSCSEKAVSTFPNARLETLRGQGHGFDESGTAQAIDFCLDYLYEHTE